MKNPTVHAVTALMLMFGMSLIPATASAVDVQLTPDLPFVSVLHEGQTTRVDRIQDTENHLTGGFTKTSRQCPPFCIQPMQVEEGVTVVGEAEVFSFMEDQVYTGRGVIVDARTPSWYLKGTIPGSVNIPFTVFEAPDDDPKLYVSMKKLKGKKRDDVGTTTRTLEKGLATVGLFNADKKTDEWDFSYAKDVLLWCNGPWCGQSPRAIKALLAKGYPPEKIFYYRGGMQMWKMLGLTTVIPDDNSYADRGQYE